MKFIVNGETVEAPSGGSGIPSGGIIIWSGTANDVPDGWALCDGENGTPDLRGRFVLGSSESHALGSTGGSETVTLAKAQMPAHSHNLRIFRDSSTSKMQSVLAVGDINNNMPSSNLDLFTVATGTFNTASVGDPQGSSQAHSNMPPYYVLAYIMKL